MVSVSVATRVCRWIHTVVKAPERWLADEPSEKLLFVHAILEGLSAINEYHRDFVVELAAKITVGVDVDFLPGEAASSRELAEAFFDDFTQMTSFAGVHDDGSWLGHVGRDSSVETAHFSSTKPQVRWLDHRWFAELGTQ